MQYIDPVVLLVNVPLPASEPKKTGLLTPRAGLETSVNGGVLRYEFNFLLILVSLEGYGIHVIQ